MTYVVKGDCIKCKHMDCVELCPTDCFREGENMLVIYPDDCIDCGVCVPECPIDAITGVIHEDDDLIEDERYWLNINVKYSAVWPEITRKGTVPVDADKWKEGRIRRSISLKSRVRVSGIMYH